MSILKTKLGQLFGARTPSLGAREIELMKILWHEGEVSAQELRNRIQDTAISLSTIQSTMERLFRKKFVSRRKLGRFYLYKPLVSQSEIVHSLLKDISMQISDGSMAPIISGFIGFVEESNNKNISAIYDRSRITHEPCND
jgi:predicted transcriptional regulator